MNLSIILREFLAEMGAFLRKGINCIEALPWDTFLTSCTLQKELSGPSVGVSEIVVPLSTAQLLAVIIASAQPLQLA
jgi:hypothetical protein